jgi:tRNA(Ile)-lysidine synthetase-like protein
MTTGGSPLPALFRDRVRDSGLVSPGDTLVVALSGGRDSVTLTHLLRFAPELPRLRLVVAHVDHGMRPDSGGDADWVRGLAGLRGIRERRRPRVWRPLLTFSREDLRAYADGAGLSWRDDPTNREPWPRNVLRLDILPRLEEVVAPGASRSLVRLARLARDNEEAWESLMPGLLEAAGLRQEPAGWSVDRRGMESFHPAVRARLLRALTQRLEVTPSEAGTRLAVEFTSSGASGRWVPLGGDVRLVRDLERLRVERSFGHRPDETVTIPEPGEGSARAVLGGRAFLVTWSRVGHTSEGEGVFGVAGARFPLEVRGPRPGDRMVLEYGTKKVTKLLLEARVPAGERGRTPLLADADGAVLWVAGLRRSHRAGQGGKDRIFVRIADAESD